MSAWGVILLVLILLLGLAVKTLRWFIVSILCFLVIELAVIIAWPKTLVWLAEIALRVKGIGQAF